MVRHFVPSVEELVSLGEESNTEFKQLGVELELNMPDLKLNTQSAGFNQKKKVNTYNYISVLGIFGCNCF